KTLRGPRGGLIVTNDLELLKRVNTAIFPGGQGGPLMHVIASKAIALREAALPSFVQYQQQVVANAGTLAATLVDRGLRIVSGGTDNHLLLVDVGSGGMTGAQAEDALHSVNITCNKNLIPYDQRPPMQASGIRLGTAAITTRGLTASHMQLLGTWIADRIEQPQDDAVRLRILAEVAELTSACPIYA
ncbi:MAG: serine hydroxymethyltransferase, partial [Planctomycetota bacterium]